MAKYRKKPVVIEAVQFIGNFDEIEKFVGGDAEFRDGKLLVATLEGPLWASNFDYIIKGVKGEFYPCKPDIFEETYEKVTENDKGLTRQEIISLLKCEGVALSKTLDMVIAHRIELTDEKALKEAVIDFIYGGSDQ